MTPALHNEQGGPVSAGAAFHERIAGDWSRGYSRGGFQRRLAFFGGVIERTVRQGDAWLDLGCGSGVLTRELMRHGATDVVAVDGSPAMLEHAAADVVAPEGVALSWVAGDVQQLSHQAPESFDGVLCSSVIEYVDRPALVLNEIRRILRKGGRFIVSLPPKHSFVRSLQKTVRLVARPLGKDPFPYLAVSQFEASPRDIEKLFGLAGLSISRIDRFDPLLPALLLPVFTPSLLIVEGSRPS